MDEGLEAQELGSGRLPEAGGGVEAALRIGNRGHLGPQPGHHGVCDLFRPLMDQDDPRKLGVSGGDPPQVGDGLPAKQSAEVSEKHEQRRLRADLVTGWHEDRLHSIW